MPLSPNQHLLSYRPFRLWPWQKFSPQEQTHFCNHMATFLESHLTLMEALKAYQEYHPKHAHTILLIQEQLTQGRSLSEAFELLPLLPLLVHSIRVAEQSGRMGLCFRHLHTYCHKAQSNKTPRSAGPLLPDVSLWHDGDVADTFCPTFCQRHASVF